MATILCASSPMALMPFSKLPPECAALPDTSKRRNTPPLRPVTMLPLGRPGSELKTQRAPRATRSMIGRDEGEPISSSLVMRPARGRRPAEPLEGREHESIDDEPALHVGDARTVGAAVLDAERPAAGLALREHGVAVAHQHDRPLVGAGVVEPDVDGVAEVSLGSREVTRPCCCEEVDEAPADGVDAGLVVAAAVDVHDLGQQRQHGLLLRAEPLGDLRLLRRLSDHAFPFASKAALIAGPGTQSLRRRRVGRVEAFQSQLRHQVEHHLARGLRPPQLHEAQVSGGDLGLQGQVELAHAPPLPPFAQQIADRLDPAHHGAILQRRTRAHQLPAR